MGTTIPSSPTSAPIHIHSTDGGDEHMHTQDAFVYLPSLDNRSSTGWGPEVFSENGQESGTSTVANSPTRYKDFDFNPSGFQTQQKRSQPEPLSYLSVQQKRQEKGSASNSGESKLTKRLISAGWENDQVCLDSEPCAKAGTIKAENGSPRTTQLAQGKQRRSRHTRLRPKGIQKKRPRKSKGTASALKTKLDKEHEIVLELP